MHLTVEPLRVPYLTQRRIEHEAQLLLAEFRQGGEWDGEFPVPMDRLIEVHLGLSLVVEDLASVYPDAVGALRVVSREVVIDESLDPDQAPDVEGRYRFTLAHEVGHWLLHRHWLTRADGVAVVCQTGQARRSLEWQADYFAAALLMPKPLVQRAWRDLHGGQPLSSGRFRGRWQDILAEETTRSGYVPEGERAEEDMVLAVAARTVAEQFAVSSTAMRIRLEHLGLLLRGVN